MIKLEQNGALRISLKGKIKLKALVSPTWNFAELGEYLQSLAEATTPPLIHRNHELFDDQTSTELHEHLGQTFDCHFIEEKLLLSLKFEKLLAIEEALPLPLNLNEAFGSDPL
ncbi:MAG: hypothetical protein ACOYK9_03080 [Chlamydiia bacterium]